tara:strand:+ start:2315 stop:3316 length:1002 start_codon:yes stop_codon:yes gene_type:complete
MKRILLTGCAGFIGYHLAKRLLSNSYIVIGIDNMNSYYDVSLKESRLSGLTEESNFSFINQDISSESILSLIPEDIDIIINLAAQAGVRNSIDNPSDYTSSNLVGFSNILELARRKKSRLIYASTSSVYGANENQPFSELNIADHPIQYYAATKRANEIMAHSYSSMYQIESIGLRFFTVYGPYGRPDMALFKFTSNILKGLPIQVFNNGNHIRDFTYIDDIVDGITACISYIFSEDLTWDAAKPSPEKSSAPYRIFNLGNSKPVKLLEYVKIIEELLNKKAIVEYLPLQKGDVISTESDISLAKRELGFNPKTNIKEGISNFLQWYKDYYNC